MLLDIYNCRPLTDKSYDKLLWAMKRAAKVVFDSPAIQDSWFISNISNFGLQLVVGLHACFYSQGCIFDEALLLGGVYCQKRPSLCLHLYTGAERWEDGNNIQYIELNCSMFYV